ncbi:unnamed protein product, partial [Urochloa humidicola]
GRAGGVGHTPSLVPAALPLRPRVAGAGHDGGEHGIRGTGVAAGGVQQTC